MSESWPPTLKDWVAKCLGQMTDSNREEAQAELRKVIQDAFQAKTLWTVDWAGMQLQSLQPKAPSIFMSMAKQSPSTLLQGGVKRKAEPLPNKKNKKAALAKQVNLMASEDQVAKERRARRFERELELERNRIPGVETPPSNSYSLSPSPFVPAQVSRRPSPYRIAPDNADALDVTADPDILNWDRHTIKGRSQVVFKDYLRLTEEVNPDNIRPLEVLRQTLEGLKRKWKTERNYNWICSQFKSMRQDLTVQRIKEPFTVEVYEIHARIALEEGDLVEFNQCLSALRTLYSMGVAGKRNEFTAYRILYMLHARQRSELNRLIGELTAEQKASKEILHSLRVSTAMSTSNYHSFFQLFRDPPNMGGYIMDLFVPSCRIQALMIMCRAYQKVSLQFVHDELAFEETLEETHNFLVSNGCAYYTNPNAQKTERIIDVKQAGPACAVAWEEKYSRVAIKGRI